MDDVTPQKCACVYNDRTLMKLAWTGRGKYPCCGQLTSQGFIGAVDHTENQKTIGNKGDFEIDEIRNCCSAAYFHNSL